MSFFYTKKSGMESPSIPESVYPLFLLDLARLLLDLKRLIINNKLFWYIIDTVMNFS